MPGILPVDAPASPKPPEEAPKKAVKKPTGKVAKKPTGKMVKKASSKATKKGATKGELADGMILVHCPNPDCKKEFRVKSKFEGRKGKCPACKTAVDVPVSGEKVVCFLCDKVLPKSKTRQRGDEFYCTECEDFLGGN
jgi:hypothetical protein